MTISHDIVTDKGADNAHYQPFIDDLMPIVRRSASISQFSPILDNLSPIRGENHISHQ